jgi:nucleoside-diphosphate-sugar epimerase
MNVLVLGATGKTGRELVKQLLERDHDVRLVVRSPGKLPDEVAGRPKASVIEASILDLTDDELAGHVEGCDAVVSCLGHVLDFRGIYGEPRKLCTDATRRACEAIDRLRPSEPTRFILMNTVGVANPELGEQRTWHDRGLLTLLRHVLPPHRDNELAAEHLQQVVGTESEHVEWCCVRPDSLIDAEVSGYVIEPSPSTGLFTGRPTTRANVGHFMCELIDKAELWSKWKFRMPVIMNAQVDREKDVGLQAESPGAA